MAVSDIHTRMKARVWQAIAQSGVDLSSIPQDEMDRLVTTIAENVLVEMDDVLGEISGQPRSTTASTTEDGEEEEILWEGRPFLSLNIHYQITTERLRVVRGLMGKDREDIELVRIQDIDQMQSFGERMLNVGDIHVRSHDPSSPEIVLNNVADPQGVHEILRRAVLSARKRHGMRYREEM
ncbi:MAG: PH domain-containing protein [Chloroflexota bacterium]|nr:PH domain-containing protein [Chloroflexota bacterium]